MAAIDDETIECSSDLWLGKFFELTSEHLSFMTCREGPTFASIDARYLSGSAIYVMSRARRQQQRPQVFAYKQEVDD